MERNSSLCWSEVPRNMMHPGPNQGTLSTGQSEAVGRRRRPYPSDLSQRQWGRIAGCLSPDSRLGRRRSTNLREVVNAVNYRWTTGCAWRMLPHDFPPWETVYTYFRNWQRNGTLPKVRMVCLRRRCT